MNITPTAIPDVLMIEPRVFRDPRGFFVESWNHRSYAGHGMDRPFLQDNHSRSSMGVLRGLHYQLRQPQGKLVRVVGGEVFDVAVDIRRGSPTFGNWVGAMLTDENHLQLWIPPGFAHGFLVMSEQADFLYKCTDNYYAPDDDYGIRWNDPEIGIEWPALDVEFVLSDKDRRHPSLDEMDAQSLPVCERR